jgi:hypothetical protein
MLIGQCLLFNELVADGGRNVLIGTMDSPKPRAQSKVNALGRSLHQSIKTFLRPRDKSSAAVAPADDVRETMAAAERGVDSLRKAPAPREAADPPRQDSQKRWNTTAIGYTNGFVGPEHRQRDADQARYASAPPPPGDRPAPCRVRRSPGGRTGSLVVRPYRIAGAGQHGMSMSVDQP